MPHSVPVHMDSWEKAMETHWLGYSSSRDAALVFASLNTLFHKLYIRLVKMTSLSNA